MSVYFKFFSFVNVYFNIFKLLPIYHLKWSGKLMCIMSAQCRHVESQNTDTSILPPPPPRYKGPMPLVHLDVLSLRPQTNTTSASARDSLLAASAARFGPSALKVRSFWMDYMPPDTEIFGGLYQHLLATFNVY